MRQRASTDLAQPAFEGEEAERQEFFEDLLSGRGGVADLLARGERLGLRLAGPHQVMVVGPAADGVREDPDARSGDERVRAVVAARPEAIAAVGRRHADDVRVARREGRSGRAVVPRGSDDDGASP